MVAEERWSQPEVRLYLEFPVYRADFSLFAGMAGNLDPHPNRGLLSACAS